MFLKPIQDLWQRCTRLSIYYHNLILLIYGLHASEAVLKCHREDLRMLFSKIGLEQGYIFKVSIFTPIDKLHISLTVYVSCHQDGAKSILMLWLSKQIIWCLKLVVHERNGTRHRQWTFVIDWLTEQETSCFCFKKETSILLFETLKQMHFL